MGACSPRPCRWSWGGGRSHRHETPQSPLHQPGGHSGVAHAIQLPGTREKRPEGSWSFVRKRRPTLVDRMENRESFHRPMSHDSSFLRTHSRSVAGATASSLTEKKRLGSALLLCDCYSNCIGLNTSSPWLDYSCKSQLNSTTQMV